jgi:hypothetical protein
MNSPTSNAEKFESYEVQKVANGFQVLPPRSFTHDRVYALRDVYVFPTWAEASKWLGDQFRDASEGA